jgi:hypothetical protein
MVSIAVLAARAFTRHAVDAYTHAAKGILVLCRRSFRVPFCTLESGASEFQQQLAVTRPCVSVAALDTNLPRQGTFLTYNSTAPSSSLPAGGRGGCGRRKRRRPEDVQ